MSALLENPQNRRFLHGDKFVKFWEDYYANHDWLPDEMINLYFDFPYCTSNCKYCMIQPANIHKHRADVKKYEAELVKQVQEFTHLFPKRQIGQIAFGGGTASLMSRECLQGIIDAVGPAWDNAKARKMEVHPKNFTDEYVDYLINVFHITDLSMGIQTFNEEALRDQNRIGVDINDLLHYVNRLHDANVSVNMDLVALFNGTSEKDWEIFRSDMKIVREMFNPNMFFTQVNFATQERYYEYTLRMRRELIEFQKNAPEYMFADERYRILTIEDCEDYLDTTYFLVKPHYYEYLKKMGLYKTDPRYGNYIGFGGNKDHVAFSLTSERKRIDTHYDFYKNRWVHELYDTFVPKVTGDASTRVVPTISVGQYIIPPYNPDISGEI